MTKKTEKGKEKKKISDAPKISASQHGDCFRPSLKKKNEIVGKKKKMSTNQRTNTIKSLLP